MRRPATTLLLVSLGLAAGCDEEGDAPPTGSDFVPIGGEDAAPPAPDGGGADDAPPPPLRLRFEPIEQDSGALRLTDLAFLPGTGGEFLVTDKDGEVVHMRLEGAGARRLGGFTIPDVWDDSDAGLISVVPDPDFARNRLFYVGLSTSRETNVVRRYRLVEGDYEATRASEATVISVRGEGAPRSWHNVGSIGFTEEGHLWALFGDKVLDERAQDPESPLGALLRIIPSRDPTGEGYTVPPDNPFADGAGHPAVYAKGLRSPWKGLYRDGRWYVGDVGLDTVEELNVVDAPGDNLGWPESEGPCECDQFVEPWVFYGRSSGHPFVREDPDATADRHRSIYVGWLYDPRPDDPYEGRWNDVITYGDAFVGFVRARRVDGTDADWAAGHVEMPTAWAQGPDGYVYVTALGTWPVDAPVAPSPIYRAVLAD